MGRFDCLMPGAGLWCGFMTRRVSVPEKTLEHWSSMYVTYRYRSKAALWWPARGEDVDIGMLPGVPGKAVQLELKTTTPAGTGLHDVNVDLGQLWRYSRKPPGRQPFYVFPWPDWDGNLAAVARARQPRKEVTELAFRRSGSSWWFADWMVVLTTRQVADVLRSELNAHHSTARKGDRLVRIDIKNQANTIWGGKKSPAPARPPGVIRWLEFWDKLDQCGQDDWPQIVRAPRFMAERLREDDVDPEGRSGYARQEIAALLRESANMAEGELRRLPVATFEPDEEGIYRIMEDPSEEQEQQPATDDDVSELPDDNRQVVFLDSRALFHG